MSRRAALVLIAALAVPALASAAGGKDPKTRIDPADQRKATSILLRASDFAPGWKRTPPDRDDSDFTCPGFDPDGSALTVTGEANVDFERAEGLPAVFSFAEVFVSRADAAASWNMVMRPQLVGCLVYMLRQGFADSGGKVTISKQGRVAFPRVAPRTAAFRIVAKVTLTSPSGTPVVLPFTIHLIALGQGRGDAGLMAMGIGNGLPMAEIRALAKLTASRLAAARL